MRPATWSTSDNASGRTGWRRYSVRSIDRHGRDGQDPDVSVDSTAQEKNITFPTDAKLYKKIIDKCVAKAKREGPPIRRSYRRTAKQLMRDTYNGGHIKRAKKSAAARRKPGTIAGRLVRELERNLPPGDFKTELDLYNRVLDQERDTKNKIYSLHEPEVYCMGKGKAHKKYEQGCKASVVLTQNTGIIVGAMTFGTNVYDGHTLEDVPGQTAELTGRAPRTATVDRGHKGRQSIGDTGIPVPGPPLKRDSEYQKRKKRNHHRRRAAIEPIIGHLKTDHRADVELPQGTDRGQHQLYDGRSGVQLQKVDGQTPKNGNLALDPTEEINLWEPFISGRNLKKILGRAKNPFLRVDYLTKKEN